MEMRKIEDESFEEQWKKSLDGVEMTPPEGVWAAIDGEIANDEAIRFKKQMVFYRAIAASLLFLLVSALAIAWQLGGRITSNDVVVENDLYEYEAHSGELVADYPKLTPNPALDFSSLINEETVEVNTHVPASVVLNRFPANGKTTQSMASVRNHGNQVVDETLENNLDVEPNKTREYLVENSSNADYTLLSSERVSNIEISRKSLEADDVLYASNFDEEEDFYFQRVPVYNYRVKQKDLIANNPSSWADFNLRGGVFEPNYQKNPLGNSALESLEAKGVNNLVERTSSFSSDAGINGEDLTAGYSYTMSLSYGRKIFNRFFLVSGLEYGIYETLASTNKVLSVGQEARVAITEQIIADGDIDLQNSNLDVGFENVELNNSFQFASVPVRVGYTILNSKLSLSVNSGISTGFYLGNSLKDPDRSLDEVTVSRSGGISIGYKLFDNYLFTLEPTYQRALSSFTRNSSDFTALPENFAVSAGIRVYIK